MQKAILSKANEPTCLTTREVIVKTGAHTRQTINNAKQGATAIYHKTGTLRFHFSVSAQ
jgi:hypothetical protein